MDWSFSYDTIYYLHYYCQVTADIKRAILDLFLDLFQFAIVFWFLIVKEVIQKT